MKLPKSLLRILFPKKKSKKGKSKSGSSGVGGSSIKSSDVVVGSSVVKNELPPIVEEKVVVSSPPAELVVKTDVDVGPESDGRESASSTPVTISSTFSFNDSDVSPTSVGKKDTSCEEAKNDKSEEPPSTSTVAEDDNDREPQTETSSTVALFNDTKQPQKAITTAFSFEGDDDETSYVSEGKEEKLVLPESAESMTVPCDDDGREVSPVPFSEDDDAMPFPSIETQEQGVSTPTVGQVDEPESVISSPPPPANEEPNDKPRTVSFDDFVKGNMEESVSTPPQLVQSETSSPTNFPLADDVEPIEKVSTVSFSLGNAVASPKKQLNAIQDHGEVDNAPTSVNSRQQPASFSILRKVTVSPQAEKARQKAIERQQRILSKCAERLDALSGTASATLEEASRVKGMERVQESKGVAAAISAVNKASGGKSGEKSYSTVVFYENKPTQLFEELEQITAEHAKEQIGRNDVDTSVAVTTSIKSMEGEINTIQFFVLLLCPKSRIFELIEIADAPKSSTVGGVLERVTEKCTDERLLEMSYIGLCRPSDRTEFNDLNANAFQNKDQEDDWLSNDCIHEDDVLVAVLKGSSGYQMSKISKPILRNSKFRDMIRRRRRSNKQSSKSRDKTPSVEVDTSAVESGGSNSIDVCDGGSVTGSITGKISPSKRPRAGSVKSNTPKKEKYITLCMKLENLSKKLHQVDEEIMGDDGSKGITAEGNEPSTEKGKDGYHMTPKMVAFELAHHIEDIFADHDVEILAVDADEDEGDSDDDTFVSARSRRSARSTRSVRSLMMAKKLAEAEAAPMEITTQKKRKPRNATSLFESNEDNALALQIEAMAAQAEEAFESRHGKKISEVDVEAVTINVDGDVDEVPPVLSEEYNASNDVLDESFDAGEDSIPIIPEDFESDDILGAMKALTKGPVQNMSSYTASQKEALSKNFLNTSTSMGEKLVCNNAVCLCHCQCLFSRCHSPSTSRFTVSTMVAASHGRVNEVHVLQYLGVTIVCLAANFVQQSRQAQPPKSVGFGAKEVIESAMFLAFMVNGQRYLAKVTKK